MGPLEFLVIRFEGNKFSGEIVPEVSSLAKNGTIRLMDVLFLTRDGNGPIRTVELNELSDEQFEKLGPIEIDEIGWFSTDDIERIGDSLEPNSSVAMILFEHAWASNLAETVRRANGELLVDERIPIAVAEEIAAGKSQQVSR